MVLDKIAAILLITEPQWKIERLWKTEQKVTMGIPNGFGILAPIKFSGDLDTRHMNTAI